MSLKKGTQVMVMREEPNGWSKGTLVQTEPGAGVVSGWFPSQYVKVLLLYCIGLYCDLLLD